MSSDSMEQLSAIMERLPSRHQTALKWFLEHAGSDQSWPQPLSDGTLLATRAKGIYKPEWTQYALSVRQSLSSLYQDLEPFFRPDGTWSFFYFQENLDPEERDLEYTNRGLVNCWTDRVPVGVMRQSQSSPEAAYRVLGVALVAGWSEGYFIFEGFNANGRSHGMGSANALRSQAASVQPENAHSTSLNSTVEGRERILASIIRRRGQPEFRASLLEAYGGRCAITGCDAADALEAAHIIPYSGAASNHPSNGLLLRADVHTLFDLGLISIDSTTMTVQISPDLAKTVYGELEGKRLRLPEVEPTRPTTKALDQHRVWAAG